MGMHGADVAGLRSLATSFERGADDLETTRAALRHAIEGSRWQGADAAEMRGAWSSMADRALAQACRVLADYATALRRDADEQETASTGGAPGPAPHGAPGPGPGGTTPGTTTPGTTTPGGTTQGGDGAAHLLPEEGGALGTVGDTTTTLKNDHASLRLGEGGPAGRVELPGGGHVGADRDGYEVGVEGKTSVGSSVEGVGSLEISSGVEVVGSRRTQGGFDEYTLAADASTTVEGDLSLWRVQAEGKAADGDRFTFGVRVPEGAGLDPATVDPFAPGDYPPGTRITLTGEAYRAHETTFGLDLVRSAHSAEDATGVTTTVEWLEDGRVRINAGDTESMSLYEGVGLGKGDHGAMIGHTSRLAGAEMGEVTLDLSSDAGRAAYDRFLRTGELPSGPADGVSGTTTYSTYDFSSGSSVELSSPVLTYVREHVTSSGSGLTVLHPDGTSDHHGQVALAGGVERTYSHHLGTDGEIVPARSTDSYVFRATETTDSLLNNPNLALGDGTSAAPGSTVRVTFTPAQTAELQQLAAAHADPTSGGPIADLVWSGTDPFAPGGPVLRTPAEFADALYAGTGQAGAGAGGDLMLDRVSTILSRAGTDELPGTVEVVP